MSKLREIIGASLVAVTALVAPASCTGEVHYAVNEPPPVPISEPVIAPHGGVWIPGYWANVDSHWAWHGGHIEDARPGMVYEPGTWRRSGDQYVWIAGKWRPETAVMVHR